MSIESPLRLSSLHADEMRLLKGSTTLLIILGILEIIVGCLAIGSSFIATLATIMVIGIFLLVGAGVEAVSAFVGHSWRGFFLHLLAAALYLILGLLMLQDPLQAAAALTLMMAAVFLVGGIMRIVYSLSERFPGWGWVCLNGVITLWLGIFIWRRWPEASLWVIGLFVGIDLLFSGWSSVMLGLGIRQLSRPTT
jgi:uncharacterized membrane protein HdeD (DUF308 family)